MPTAASQLSLYPGQPTPDAQPTPGIPSRMGGEPTIPLSSAPQPTLGIPSRMGGAPTTPVGQVTPFSQLFTQPAQAPTGPAQSSMGGGPVGTVRPFSSLFGAPQPQMQIPRVQTPRSASLTPGRPMPQPPNMPPPSNIPRELSQARDIIGGVRTGIDVANTVGSIGAPRGTPPTVDTQVSGGVNTLAGGLGVATAIMGDAPDTARATGGLASGIQGIQGLENLTRTPIVTQATEQAFPGVSASGNLLGQVGAGAGSVAGAINLATNWDQMEDFQRALGTAQVVNGAMAAFGYAIPYVGPILAAAGFLSNMLSDSGGGSYSTSRSQASADVRDNAPRVLEDLAHARNEWEIARAIESANRSSTRARWSESGVGAYEMDTSRLGTAMQDIISGKRDFWAGTMTRDDPRANLQIQLAHARNNETMDWYATFFTPGGISSARAAELWNSPELNYPGWGWREKWGEIAVRAGIPTDASGQWPSDVQDWAYEVVPGQGVTQAGLGIQIGSRPSMIGRPNSGPGWAQAPLQHAAAQHAAELTARLQNAPHNVIGAGGRTVMEPTPAPALQNIPESQREAILASARTLAESGLSEAEAIAQAVNSYQYGTGGGGD